MEVAAIFGTGTGKAYAVVTDCNATLCMLVDNSINTVIWQWESNAFVISTSSVKFALLDYLATC